MHADERTTGPSGTATEQALKSTHTGGMSSHVENTKNRSLDVEVEAQSDGLGKNISIEQHGTLVHNNDIRQTIGPLTMLALCFNICSSWAGLSTSVQIALLAGGPMTLIYGVIVTTVIYLCISLSLAELASVYPTAGGQYHFSSILAPQRLSRPISYVCGFITCFYWIATGAAVAIIVGTQIATVAAWYDPPGPQHPWQLFLIFQGLGLLALLYNIFFIKKLDVTHTIGFALSIAIFVSDFIGLLVRSSPKATNEFVWTTFINETGWPDGVCFMIGLLPPFFMFGGLDGALHVAEEANNAHRVVPRVTVGVVVVGFCTAFPFAIAIMYSISDFTAIVGSSGYIPFEINRQGLRSDEGALAVLIAGIVLGFFILNAVFQASSRTVWAFARDNGFVFSSTIGRVHQRFEVPVWALLLNWLVFGILGVLILASSIAFNAILSSTVVHQLLSYLIPISLLIFQRRSDKYLPSGRSLALPNWLGWTVNCVVVLCIPVLVTFFAFPPFRPVTGTNMNYTVAVLGSVTLLCGLNWVFYARRHFQGPRIDLHQ
ncbi:hypothetical protein LTR84_006955 [Exophiala bonariae]|uniref:Amino acid permease/ SLC12A domain-containing protein n=1 Tax=Exophiala bonariae TaxID=1690606 RepID=A0AAV9MZ79_9EURO|nr:hypothetical protein LTR84_006955 [Exophiala bonariae]